jgi:asparagine N-glycosylation enzyme membrane subunit Stt3
MGMACILNARRCGRTHCRYTGPYYLAMIAPVLLLAAGIGSAGFYSSLILGILILAGSRAIWWATEHAWGKFS